ncbi:MAG TPA: hypothetical protein PKE29_15525 [Phycisphaerales bacterium]|nr:hypothetical protein [Phycisphaerales bacterium]
MTGRTSRAELASLFVRLAVAVGGDGWSLDHNSAYGGWVIVEQLGSGGEGRPFGDRRRSAGDMADVMRFALRAVAMREEVTP